MPNVIDNEELYDIIVVDGVSSGGKVTLSGHDRKVDWDVKGGPSLAGATTTFKSILPIEFTASFYLVKDVAQGIDDFAQWYLFKAVVEATVNGRTPRAKDIYHPDLAANDIKSIVKALVGGMTYDGKGGATVVVKFQEYKPPRKQAGTPKGSGTKAVDPNADVKAELARAVQQYQATPWG